MQDAQLPLQSTMSVNDAGNLGSAGYAMVEGDNWHNLIAGELNPTIVVTDTFGSYNGSSTFDSSNGHARTSPQATLSYQWQVSYDSVIFPDIVGNW